MNGIKDRISGAVKQAEGKLTGDKVRTAQGSAQATKGKLEMAASRVARKVKSGARRIEDKVRGSAARADRKTRRRTP